MEWVQASRSCLTMCSRHERKIDRSGVHLMESIQRCLSCCFVVFVMRAWGAHVSMDLNAGWSPARYHGRLCSCNSCRASSLYPFSFVSLNIALVMNPTPIDGKPYLREEQHSRRGRGDVPYVQPRARGSFCTNRTKSKVYLLFDRSHLEPETSPCSGDCPDSPEMQCARKGG